LIIIIIIIIIIILSLYILLTCQILLLVLHNSAIHNWFSKMLHIYFNQKFFLKKKQSLSLF